MHPILQLSKDRGEKSCFPTWKDSLGSTCLNLSSEEEKKETQKVVICL